MDAAERQGGDRKPRGRHPHRRSKCMYFNYRKIGDSKMMHYFGDEKTSQGQRSMNLNCKSTLNGIGVGGRKT